MDFGIGKTAVDYLIKTRLDYKLKRLYGFEFEPQNMLQDQFNNSFKVSSSYLEQFFTNNTFITPVYSSGFKWYQFFQQINKNLDFIVTSSNVRLWWNSNALHGMASTISSFNNLYLRYTLSKTGAKLDEYGIKSYLHPFKRSLKEISGDIVEEQYNNVIMAVWVIFGMSFIAANFVLYLVEERSTKSKHLQYVSGVNPTMFWVTAFIWDLSSFMVSLVLCITIFLIFQQDCYVSSDNFPCLLLLLLLYNWGVTPLMYLASFLFQNSATAFVMMILANFLIGYITTITTYMFDIFGDDLETGISFYSQ